MEVNQWMVCLWSLSCWCMFTCSFLWAVLMLSLHTLPHIQDILAPFHFIGSGHVAAIFVSCTCESWWNCLTIFSPVSLHRLQNHVEQWAWVKPEILENWDMCFERHKPRHHFVFSLSKWILSLQQPQDESVMFSLQRASSPLLLLLCYHWQPFHWRERWPLSIEQELPNFFPLRTLNEFMFFVRDSVFLSSLTLYHSLRRKSLLSLFVQPDHNSAACGVSHPHLLTVTPDWNTSESCAHNNRARSVNREEGKQL